MLNEKTASNIYTYNKFNIFSIQGLIATYALPVATISAVTLGGINFFQNNAQDDDIRENKRLIDALRRDLENIEVYDESALVGKNRLHK